MIKSLIAGAAAITLIAGAAMAQQAYDNTVTRTTTTQAVPADGTTTIRVQKAVDPYTGATVERRETTQSTSPTSITSTTSTVQPSSRVTTYHEEKSLSPGPVTIEKTQTTETNAPTEQRTTRTTTTVTNSGE